jgi:hypothetical protein
LHVIFDNEFPNPPNYIPTTMKLNKLLLAGIVAGAPAIAAAADVGIGINVGVTGSRANAACARSRLCLD